MDTEHIEELRSLADDAEGSRLFAQGLLGLARCMAESPSVVDPKTLHAFSLGMGRLVADLEGIERKLLVRCEAQSQ